VVSGVVTWLARHWLAWFLLGSGTFIALPFAAPVLAAGGHDQLSSAIYLSYRITCHQLPHRSWFVGGRAANYDWPTVRAYMGLGASEEARAFHRPIRDPELGYQMAFCQRDTATFLSLFLTAVLYGVARRRRRIRPLRLRYYALAIVPLAVDGLVQLVGLRESTPFARTVTGSLFGVATALFILPQLDLGLRVLSGQDSGASNAGRHRAV